ncbi:hypothetical protein ABPG72_018621 [Tetrahymena utriculariae]
MSAPQIEQGLPVLQELPSLQQQPISTVPIITDNAIPEEYNLKDKPSAVYRTQSEALTASAYASGFIQKEEPKGTILTASASLLKSGVGTGILFFPSLFKSCGIALSIIFCCITSIFCYFCWSLISKMMRFQESTDRNDPNNQHLTLENCGGLFYGPKFKKLLQVCTYIYSYSACFGYAIFIYKAVNPTFPNHYYTMLIMMAIFLPLSMYKKIHKLSFFTYFALTATTITLLTIIVKSCYVIHNTDVHYSSLTQFDFTQIPLSFGVFTFAYDCNGVYTEVHASMKDKRQFDTVLKIYLSIFTLIGVLVGTMGYIAFGEQTQAAIFTNIGSMQGYGTSLSFLYSFAELASMLLYIFCVVKFFDNLVGGYVVKNSSNNKFISFLTDFVVRALIFLSFAFLALYVTQMSDFFNIMGCILCSFLTYLCPLILYIKAKPKNDKLLKQVENGNQDVEKNVKATPNKIDFFSTSRIVTAIAVVCLLFGLLGGISGLISTIIQIKEKGE